MLLPMQFVCHGPLHPLSSPSAALLAAAHSPLWVCSMHPKFRIFYRSAQHTSCYYLSRTLFFTKKSSWISQKIEQNTEQIEYMVFHDASTTAILFSSLSFTLLKVTCSACCGYIPWRAVLPPSQHKSKRVLNFQKFHQYQNTKTIQNQWLNSQIAVMKGSQWDILTADCALTLRLKRYSDGFFLSLLVEYECSGREPESWGVLWPEITLSKLQY